MDIIRFFNLEINSLNIKDSTGTNLNQLFLLWFIYFIGILVILVYKYFVSNSKDSKHILKRFEFEKLGYKTYFIFYLPFIVGTGLIGYLYSINYILIAVAMGFFAFIAEYFFGKMCVLLLSKRLWDYTYYTFDNNHGTLLSIIPFSIAGFYFWTLAELVLLIL